MLSRCALSLPRSSRVSLPVPSASTKRLNEDTFVVIWKMRLDTFLLSRARSSASANRSLGPAPEPPGPAPPGAPPYASAKLIPRGGEI